MASAWRVLPVSLVEGTAAPVAYDELCDHDEAAALRGGERARCDGEDGSLVCSRGRCGELGAGLSSSETLKALIVTAGGYAIRGRVNLRLTSGAINGEGRSWLENQQRARSNGLHGIAWHGMVERRE